MLVEQQISQLKHEYGEIFSAHLEDDEVIFRALTIKEYGMLQDIKSAVDREEFVLVNAILDPSPIDLDDYAPGSVTGLYDSILELSGFTSVDVCQFKLDVARAKIDSALEMMKVFILAAFPTTDYFDLENYSFQELADMVARAEKVLEIYGGLNRGGEFKLLLEDTAAQQEDAPAAKPTSFTIEDIERENRRAAKSPNPDTAGMWDKAPKRVEEGATKLGTATADDPIAHKLWQALR